MRRYVKSVVLMRLDGAAALGQRGLARGARNLLRPVVHVRLVLDKRVVVVLNKQIV